MNKDMKGKMVHYPKHHLAFVKKKAEESRGEQKETDIFRSILRKWIEDETKGERNAKHTGKN